MNAFVITCIALATATTVVALGALCYAVLTAKDGYEDENGFHAGKPALAEVPRQARRGLLRRQSQSA